MVHWEPAHQMPHCCVVLQVRGRVVLLVQLVGLLYFIRDGAYHGRHVLIALWLSRCGKTVLLVPAPLVNLSHAQTGLLCNPLALRICPGGIHLELLLQRQLLLAILLSPALCTLLLALFQSGFLVMLVDSG